VSSRIRDGDIESSEEGKRHLKFEEYKRICASLLSEGCNLSQKRVSEMHLFIVMSWNLCARADTTVSLHSSLLSLSAAASGMMVGERQLGSLKEFIDASIRNAFQSSTSSIGMSECGIQRPRDYQFFSWGGKMRHVPAGFNLVRPGSTLAEIWDLWWLGDLSPESPVRPFRQILKNNRALKGNTESRTLEGITSTQLWQSSG
jgi:hypothetical protein